MSKEKELIVNEITKLLLNLVEDEPKKAASVWDLKPGDTCWVITGPGRIQKYKAGHAYFAQRRAKGDAFLTEAAARTELAIRIQTARTNPQGLCS